MLKEHFHLYGTVIDTITVIRHGKVRRAKLYYLRDRTGKSARIAEKIRKKIGIEVDIKPETVTEETLAPVAVELEKKPEVQIEIEKQPEAQAEPKIEKTEEKKISFFSMPLTLYDKIWNDHLVDQQNDGTALLFVDRHLVHEVTSPQAFEGLRKF